MFMIVYCSMWHVTVDRSLRMSHVLARIRLYAVVGGEFWLMKPKEGRFLLNAWSKLKYLEKALESSVESVVDLTNDNTNLDVVS